MEHEDPGSKIRVVIIDDDSTWIQKLTDFIQSSVQDIKIAGSASTIENAIEMVKTINPDVVLSDLINPVENRYDGIDAAYEIINISEVKVMMLTEVFEEKLVLESFAAGAVNYLFKSDLKLVPDAIRSIFQKTTVIEILAKDYRRLKILERKEKLFNGLSEAEKGVMNLYILGYKRKEIAANLGKTEYTIKNQISSSLKKLKVRNRRRLLSKLYSRRKHGINE